MSRKLQKILPPEAGGKGKARKRRQIKSAKAKAPLLSPNPPELMHTATRDAVTESGVLAFRRRRNGKTSILLITRRRSKKWGIPKGKIEPGLSFSENAAKEAFEEAGVTGEISSDPAGLLRLNKRGADQKDRLVVEVWIYLLRVTETYRDWPERRTRQIQWMSCERAARLLQAPVLAHLCLQLAQA